MIFSFANLYCYSKPSNMVGHKFTDTVAIVIAPSKKMAIQYFKKFYSDVFDYDVYRLKIKPRKILILTDY